MLFRQQTRRGHATWVEIIATDTRSSMVSSERSLAHDATGTMSVLIERLVQDRVCASSNPQDHSLTSAPEGAALELAPPLRLGASDKPSLLRVTLARRNRHDRRHPQLNTRVFATCSHRTALAITLLPSTLVTRCLQATRHLLAVQHSRWSLSLAPCSSSLGYPEPGLEASLALKDSLPATRGSPVSELARCRRQLACERIRCSSRRGAKVTMYAKHDP